MPTNTLINHILFDESVMIMGNVYFFIGISVAG